MAESTRFHKGAVRGHVHSPARSEDGLVITHGAGGNCDMPLLVTVAEAFAAAEVCVLRCDLPFRQKRRYGAPSPAAAAEDRAGLKEAVAAMREIAPGRLFLGGQSYGGRQASMLAAEEPGLADALLLLSYPLHPPGNPEKRRTDHFPSLRIPTLFVHGSRDPFGSLDEMQVALKLIPALAALVKIEGAGHDLARGNFDLTNLVVDQFRRLIARAAC